jgi:Septum formation
MRNLGIYAVLALGYFIYSAATEADRDGTGTIVDEGSVNAFEVRVGDCFDDSGDSTEITSLPGVPCSEPHDNEAFAVFDVTIATYPAGDGMWDLATNSCMERFESFVGKDYESSSLDIFTLYPTSESWKQNDREVVCAVYDVNANKLVGSAKGLAL